MDVGDGGDLGKIIQRVVAVELRIGRRCTVNGAAANTTPGQQRRETVRPVIASTGGIDRRRAAEFAAADHQS